MTLKDMIKKFQCPGCVCGVDPDDCTAYKPEPIGSDGGNCTAHVAGTSVFPGGTFALGLPKGFDKVGAIPRDLTTNLRLWPAGAKPRAWDWLNVPVWALEAGGFLYVRTYQPRLNIGWVDVIEGGKLADCPVSTLDVAKFQEEID